jgi:hypothetical protein
MYIENNTWARGDMKFTSSSMLKLDVNRFELEHKKINSYLQASMYYYVYYINISLKSRKKNCGNRWLTKLNSISTHVKNYHIRTHVLIRFFSVVEIPITHYSLYNKYIQYIYTCNSHMFVLGHLVVWIFEDEIIIYNYIYRKSVNRFYILYIYIYIFGMHWVPPPPPSRKL